MTTRLHRPEPILRHNAAPVDQRTPPLKAAMRLRHGEQLIVTDLYKTGAEIIAKVQNMLRPPPSGASYADRQAARRLLRETSLRLLAPVAENRLALKDAQPNEFLAELYPEHTRFALPFVQVQELHGAWGRYREGVHLSVLGHRIHPFFGTYVPTRMSHLELFGTWLSQSAGARASAVDVGTGCGVLAFMLAKSGFERVLATDVNPNALESVARDLRRNPGTPPIELMCGDLLCEGQERFDLIVFNPPWMMGAPEGLLDESLYFESGLFERFFTQAAERLSPEGRVVLLFSNVLQLVQPDVPHPILSELERGRFCLVHKRQRKVKPGRDASGARRRTRERVEIWELARVGATLPAESGG